jgi:hypothetical protein
LVVAMVSWYRLDAAHEVAPPAIVRKEIA